MFFFALNLGQLTVISYFVSALHYIRRRIYYNLSFLVSLHLISYPARNTAIAMSTKRPLAPPKSSDVIESHTASWSEEKRARYAEYLATQKLDAEPIVKERDHAILSFGKGDAFVTVRSGSDIRMKSLRAKMDPIVNQPFHAVYTMGGGTLTRREGGPLSATLLFDHLEGTDTDATFLPAANNSELFDNADNQTLSAAEINRMKAAGASGDEIIRAVAAASKTFEGKTEYSQEKWLLKKQAKYSTDVQIIRPTPSAIISVLLERDPRKILALRDDTLAQLLTSANVAAGSVTLVVDGAAGLVAGAAAQRQGGHGAVIALHAGAVASLPLAQDLNLGTEAAAALMPLPAHILGEIAPVNRLKAAAPFKPEPMTIEPLFEEDVPAALEAAAAANAAAAEARAAAAAAGADAAAAAATLPPRGDSPMRLVHRRAVGHLTRGAHCLIVATFHSPAEAVLPLLPYLRPSSPFVVYCPYVEPLARLQSHLIATRQAVGVQVTETWYRPLQVLPNRTHPHMSMNATGGYLLHGTTVALD